MKNGNRLSVRQNVSKANSVNDYNTILFIVTLWRKYAVFLKTNTGLIQVLITYGRGLNIIENLQHKNQILLLKIYMFPVSRL